MHHSTIHSSVSGSATKIVPESVRPPLPAAVLQMLAARFRGAGLFLIALADDGTVVWHDTNADPLFLRYAFPAFSMGRNGNASPGSADWVPGLLTTKVSCIEKRPWPGMLLLAGRGGLPLNDEAVLLRCGQFGLDAGWLMQQAGKLQEFDEPTLLSFSRLLAEMAHDQVRTGSMEGELDKLSTQLSNSYEELSLIYQVSSGMKVDRRPEEFFAEACQEVMSVIGVRGMGFAIDANFPGHPQPTLFGELTLASDKFYRLSADLLAVLRGRTTPLLVNDLRSDPRFAWLADDIQCLLAVPLHREQKLLGCLIALEKLTGDFDSVDSKLVHSIANESAIYLENVRLFDDVHGLMMGLLHSLTSAVDAKDTYTCGHSERVALLSRHTAREAGLSEEEIEQVYMSGLLHDVGKIGVPEAVLQKPGKLTDEEFEQMKKHPQVGADSAGRSAAPLDHPRRAAPPREMGRLRLSHETGRRGHSAHGPHHLPGRLLRRHDLQPHLSRGRPFESALEEIAKCSGKHFDPELAAAFLRTSADGYRELLSEYQDKSRKLLEPRDQRRREPPIAHGAARH